MSRAQAAFARAANAVAGSVHGIGSAARRDSRLQRPDSGRYTLSGLNLTLTLAYANAEYQNLLLNLAFSNFEAILTEVTLNPTMGRYLDMVNNGKLISSIDQANENYARELLQLIFISRTHPERTSPITIPKPLTTVLYGVFSIKTVLPAVPRKI